MKLFSHNRTLVQFAETVVTQFDKLWHPVILIMVMSAMIMMMMMMTAEVITLTVMVMEVVEMIVGGVSFGVLPSINIVHFHFFTFNIESDYSSIILSCSTSTTTPSDYLLTANPTSNDNIGWNEFFDPYFNRFILFFFLAIISIKVVFRKGKLNITNRNIYDL